MNIEFDIHLHMHVSSCDNINLKTNMAPPGLRLSQQPGLVLLGPSGATINLININTCMTWRLNIHIQIIVYVTLGFRPGSGIQDPGC